MRKVILDENISEQLRNSKGYAELHNSAGDRIGYFLPPSAFVKVMYAWAKQDITDEEVEAAERDFEQNGGLTTSEVLEHLRTLESLRGRPA